MSERVTPRMLDFLAAWFQSGGSNVKAAERLGTNSQIVRNTLMYLRRVEGAPSNMVLAMTHMEQIRFRDVVPVGEYERTKMGLTREESLARRRDRYQHDPEYRERVKRLSRNSMRNHRSRNLKYQALVERNGEQCEICGRPKQIVMGPDQVIRRLAIDHDHATGATRGLLCTQCNTMLGNAGDSPERLEAAAAYLRRHAAQHNRNVPEAERESA